MGGVGNKERSKTVKYILKIKGMYDMSILIHVKSELYDYAYKKKF